MIYIIHLNFLKNVLILTSYIPLNAQTLNLNHEINIIYPFKHIN
jgi:hypothetical protein